MNIRNLNKFWWIFEMVVTCGFKHGPKVVASSYKWDLWYRIELIIQHWIKMNVFRLNAIAESHIQFWNSSELIKILVYFITLCHGWPCRGCHRERRALGWKIHLNACLTVTRFKWNNIIVLMACLWLYCTVHNGVKLFMESYKVQVFWEGHINPELFFN